MSYAEGQYLDLMAGALRHGEPRVDRTGVGTLAVFGGRLQFDLMRGFPLITTKRLHFKSIATELFWMLGGHTNVNWLRERGVTIWDEWADDDGELGPVYGHQWRAWGGPSRHPWHEPVDQIAQLIQGLRTEPHGRRHILSAWNVADLPRMALAPCHLMAQFYSSRNPGSGVSFLSCQVYQRSADIFLGLPFNIASYALLTHLIAKATGHQPGHLIFALGDAHLYVNHVRQAQEQLTREPLPFPTLTLADKSEIDDFEPADVVLRGYGAHPHISAGVAK